MEELRKNDLDVCLPHDMLNVLRGRLGASQDSQLTRWFGRAQEGVAHSERHGGFDKLPSSSLAPVPAFNVCNDFIGTPDRPSKREPL